MRISGSTSSSTTARALTAAAWVGVLAMLAWGPGVGNVHAAPGAFSRNALLASIGRNVMLPTYNRFNLSAARLGGALNAYCTAAKTRFASANPTAARLAWRAAMNQWQIAEMFQFGPVAMNGGVIRNNIYSWPLENTCSVDQNVVNFENNRNPDGSTPFSINATTVDSRGLPAIGYLLFAVGKNHTCPVQVAVTRGWNQRPLAAREAARCEYAIAAARHVKANAQALVNAWAPGRGNYLRDLATAGQPGSSFPSAHAAINEVSDAMFYLENEVKEMKLGEPLGKFDNNCGPGEICPEELESLKDRTNNGRLDALIYNSGHAKQMLRQNFIAFQQGFHGGAPGNPLAIGFDDFLASLGQRVFANQMAAQLRALVASVDSIDGTLNAALATDFRAVDDVYELRLQPISIRLRNQFLSILGLEAPASSASDTD
ncbi:MAG: imelysin family protein [Gammaproteobacteria bacterium]